MDIMASTSEILKNGMQCLKENLGDIGAEQFIAAILSEKLDYTKWQREYFDKITSEQFDKNLTDYVNEHEHKGSANIII